MSEISELINRELIICPRLTMFPDNESKQSYVRGAKIEANEKVESGKSTPLEGDALIRTWEEDHTIGTTLREIRNSGIIAVLPMLLVMQFNSKRKEHKTGMHMLSTMRIVFLQFTFLEPKPSGHAMELLWLRN